MLLWTLKIIKTIGEKSIINISDFSNIKIMPEELGKNTITEEYPNGKWWVEKEELREIQSGTIIFFEEDKELIKEFKDNDWKELSKQILEK